MEEEQKTWDNWGTPVNPVGEEPKTWDNWGTPVSPTVEEPKTWDNWGTPASPAGNAPKTSSTIPETRITEPPEIGIPIESPHNSGSQGSAPQPTYNVTTEGSLPNSGSLRSTPQPTYHFTTEGNLPNSGSQGSALAPSWRITESGGIEPARIDTSPESPSPPSTEIGDIELPKIDIPIESVTPPNSESDYNNPPPVVVPRDNGTSKDKPPITINKLESGDSHELYSSMADKVIANIKGNVYSDKVSDLSDQVLTLRHTCDALFSEIEGWEGNAADACNYAILSLQGKMEVIRTNIEQSLQPAAEASDRLNELADRLANEDNVLAGLYEQRDAIKNEMDALEVAYNSAKTALLNTPKTVDYDETEKYYSPSGELLTRTITKQKPNPEWDSKNRECINAKNEYDMQVLKYEQIVSEVEAQMQVEEGILDEMNYLVNFITSLEPQIKHFNVNTGIADYRPNDTVAFDY